MSRGNIVSKRELIIETWEQLDCESVGAQELEQIQAAVSDRLGPGAVDSPASIARTLADEGAVLRHPEVLGCDALWRERDLAQSLLPDSLNFDGLKEAAAAIGEIEQLRQDAEAESRAMDLRRLREAVQGIRGERLLLARSNVIKQQARREAAEVAEWLRVWLSTPGLFADWLDLRQRSAEFRARFGQTRLP